MKKSKKVKYSLWAILSAISALLFIVLIQSGLHLLFPYQSYADSIISDILLLLWLPLLGAIFGIIAIIDIRKNKRKGLWLAIIGILVGLGWFLLLEALKRIGTV